MIYRTIKSKENPYSVIPNAIINNPDLSYKAKGILIYLISKPDQWKAREEDIVEHGKDGIDAVRTAIKELINAGYIIRQRVKGKDGKFLGWESYVYEEPQNENTDIGKSDIGKTTVSGEIPTSENPTSENPRLLITDNILNTDIYNNTTHKGEKPKKYSDEVHEISEYYQKKLKEFFPSFTAVSKNWFIRQLQTANALLKKKTKEEIINLIDATFLDKYWSSRFTTLGVLESTQTILEKPLRVLKKPLKPQPKIGEKGPDGKIVVDTDFDEHGNYIEDWYERAVRRKIK